MASGDYGLVFRVLRMVDSSKARVRHVHTNRSEAPCRCFKRPPRMRKIPTWCWTFHEGPTARQSGKPTEGPSRLPGFQPVGDSLEMHRKAGEAMASRQSERRRTRPGSKRERESMPRGAAFTSMDCCTRQSWSSEESIKLTRTSSQTRSEALCSVKTRLPSVCHAHRLHPGSDLMILKPLTAWLCLG